MLNCPLKTVAISLVLNLTFGSQFYWKTFGILEQINFPLMHYLGKRHTNKVNVHEVFLLK